MTHHSYQWMSPLGRLSEPFSLDEIQAHIEQGRAFSPQGISRDGAEPVAAVALPELRDVWGRVSPPYAPFDGSAGRVGPMVLARLVTALAVGRASGYLSVRQSDAHLHFMVRVVDGQVLDIYAHDPSTYLGQLLVQQGVITPVDLEGVLRLAFERAEPVGKVCVEEGLISVKRLNRALAEQLFTRLRRIACFPKCDVLFRADRVARMLPPVARISGYAALEICLGYGLSDTEIREYMEALLARPTQVNLTSPAVSMLSAEDRGVLKKVHAAGSLMPLTERDHWTQRDGALKAIAWDLLGLFVLPRAFALAEELNALNAPNALAHIGLAPGFSEQQGAQAAVLYAESLGLSAPSESDDEERVKRALRARLEALTAVEKLSARERLALQRMEQLGAPATDSAMKASIMFELASQEGERALKQQRYQEAHSLFMEAASLKPSDLTAQLRLIWSSFLSSDRGEGSYQAVCKRAEALARAHPREVEVPLSLAQIQRVYGDAQGAERSLRAVLALSPDHAQAKAELRLLFTMEFDQKRQQRGLGKVVGAAGGAGVGLSTGAGRAAVGVALGLIVSLWAVGSLLPSTRTQWPEVRPLDVVDMSAERESDRRLSFYQAMRQNYDNTLVVSSAYRLGLRPAPQVTGNDTDGYDLSALGDDELREVARAAEFLYGRYVSDAQEVTAAISLSRVIPAPQRVLGVVEGYWLSDDPFWWGRRLLLLLAGLVGLAVVRPWRVEPRPRAEEQPWSLSAVGLTPALWTSVGLLYAVAVGLLTPAVQSPTPLWTLAAMLTLHAAAEQVFFTGYVGGALLKGSAGFPAAAFGVVVSLFALYKLSFYYIWSQPSALLIAAQMALFMGGVGLALAWRTRGLAAAIIVQALMSISSLFLS